MHIKCLLDKFVSFNFLHSCIKKLTIVSTMKLRYLFTVAAALIPLTVSAEGTMEDEIERCKSLYNVQTSTSQDPRQFLIRRCITTARQKMRTAQQVERQQIRAASRYDQSAARTQQLRTENENYLQDAIRRQNLKISRFRSRTNVLSPQIFYEGRQSRRSIIRETEGLDRINAIRRNLLRSNLPDPCITVRVISSANNPCKNTLQNR